MCILHAFQVYKICVNLAYDSQKSGRWQLILKRVLRTQLQIKSNSTARKKGGREGEKKEGRGKEKEKRNERKKKGGRKEMKMRGGRKGRRLYFCVSIFFTRKVAFLSKLLPKKKKLVRQNTQTMSMIPSNIF